MSPATVTAAGAIEVRAGGSVIGGTVAYDGANHRAVVTPAAQMAAGTGYTVTVKGGATGVSDQAGNRMAANNSFSFTTAAPAGGAILGHNQVGALLDNGAMNYMNGSTFTTGASTLTPTRAYVYMTSVQSAPTNQYQIAIYTDAGGVPGNLVAATASGTSRARAAGARTTRRSAPGRPASATTQRATSRSPFASNDVTTFPAARTSGGGDLDGGN